MLAGTPIFALTLAASAGAGFLATATRLSVALVTAPALLLLVGVDVHYIAGAAVVAALVNSAVLQLVEGADADREHRHSLLVGVAIAGGAVASTYMSWFSAELWVPVLALLVTSLACDVARRVQGRTRTFAGVTNQTVGITASAVSSMFLSRGYLRPGLNAAIVLGVVSGAFLAVRWRCNGHTTHDRMSMRYGYLLQAFFVVSCGCVVAGAVLWLAGQGGDDWASLGQFIPAPVEERLAARIVSGAIDEHAGPAIQLGLLCFSTMPILSVLYALLRSTLEQDRRSTVTAALVFSVLVGSLLSGAAGGL